MRYRIKDNVRLSGCISYYIQCKWFIFWFNYQSFMSRNSRDVYFNELVKQNK